MKDIDPRRSKRCDSNFVSLRQEVTPQHYSEPSGRAVTCITVPDAVPPIHAESYHVATDKDPSK